MVNQFKIAFITTKNNTAIAICFAAVIMSRM